MDILTIKKEDIAKEFAQASMQNDIEPVRSLLHDNGEEELSGSYDQGDED